MHRRMAEVWFTDCAKNGPSAIRPGLTYVDQGVFVKRAIRDRLDKLSPAVDAEA